MELMLYKAIRMIKNCLNQSRMKIHHMLKVNQHQLCMIFIVEIDAQPRALNGIRDKLKTLE